MPKAISDIKRIFLTLLIGGCIGFALLLLAYMIPTDRMVENARASIALFEQEGMSPQLIYGYKATTLDNYTDAWMLRNAFYDGQESVLQKAMNVYYYGYTDGHTNNVCESMIAYLRGEEGYERATYTEYWHGYLIILKPLLYLFDYGDIRQILKFAALALLIYVCILLERKHMARVIPAFVAAMCCVESATIGMSLQYTSVFIIAMSFSIFILKSCPDALGNTENTENTGNTRMAVRIELLFLVIGMCTSYFDFLTYPIFTLGMPLLFWTLCMGMAGRNTGLPMMAINNALHWAVGYAGMWAQKWILYTILTGENLVAVGIRSVLYRSGREAGGESVGYFETLSENIEVICKYPYVLAVFAGILLAIGGKEACAMASKEVLITCLLIAALPPLWYAISVNHSYIHTYMTYKGLSISVFAVLCAITEMKNLIKKNQ